MITRDHDIGGAKVLRGFSMGGTYRKSGEMLSRQEVLSIPTNNRQALIDGGKMSVYPPAPESRFVVSAGFNKWHVYEGRRLTDTPVEKDEAQRIADEFGSQDEPGAGDKPVN